MKEGYKVTELGEIPEDWEIVRQGNVATFYNGRAYKLSEWEQTGTPVIRLQNLTGSGTQYYYSNLMLPNSQYCYFGDLLYMWSATFGPVWWKGEKAIYHYHIWKIEVDHNVFDKVFHYYLLDDITVQMKNQSHGSTMLHVTKGGMESFKILLPPLPEQQKIASILSTVDEKIENINVQISQTQELKKGLMQQLLTKGLGHAKFKTSELGEIPESWGIRTLDKVCSKITDGEHLSPTFLQEGFPILSAKDIKQDKIDFSKSKFISDEAFILSLKRCNPEKDDVLIVSRGATIGRATINKGEKKFALMGSVILLKAIPNIIVGKYLLYIIQSKPFQDKILSLSGSSAQQAIYLKDVKHYKFMAPTFPEQEKIAMILSCVDEKIEFLQIKKQTNLQLKKGLMQQLLTGKIRVQTSQNELSLV